MEFQKQCERETCRVIVFNRHGNDVLLKFTEAGFVFPCVEIPRWERLAENLTAALKKDFGCDAVCLFTPNNSSHEDNTSRHRYEVMECWRDQHGRGTDWKPVHSLSGDSFEDKAEFRILTECLHELDRYGHDPSSPFAQRGRLTSVRGWAAEAIRPLGLELGPSFLQYNASPFFSLIRFETNGPAVWFKAVGEPNLREFPITLKLAELFPRFIAEIIASNGDWNAWLSREVNGANLGEANDLALWKNAATGLAELQIDSISRVDSIIKSGAHDLKTNTLLDLVDPFFEVAALLMEEQPRVPPPTLSRQELSLLKLRIRDSLTLLEEFGISNTLGHLDLNPWNVVVSADGCVFLDWAEAYVGHPFFSLEYLLQHFRRKLGTDDVIESELVNAYRAPWRQLLSDDLTREAFALAPLGAVFAYVAGSGGWRDSEKLLDPKFAAYFCGTARRMNREATKFIDRRPPCLS